jgi:hypothetical protein
MATPYGWLGGLSGKAADVLPVRVGGTDYRQSTRSTPASVLGFDQALLWVVVALLAWGLVMVYSASIAMPDNPRFGKIAPTHFLMLHDVRWCGLCGGAAGVPGVHGHLGACGALAVRGLHLSCWWRC